MAWELETTLVVKLPVQGANRDYLERVGREIVMTIERRTALGKDKHGRAFAPYSEAYMKSMEFAIARKTAQVNLRLSGEMMADLSVLDVNPAKSEIMIGFTDSEQRAKAHGHITGKEGSGDLPKRDFLGISQDELAIVLSKIPTPEQYRKSETIRKDITKTLASEDEPKKGGVRIVDVYDEFERLEAEGLLMATETEVW